MKRATPSSPTLAITSICLAASMVTTVVVMAGDAPEPFPPVRLTLVPQPTTAPAPSPRLVTVVYAPGPFRTFAINGTTIANVELVELPAVLKAHKAANPDVQYELFCEVKSVPEQEKSIARAFADAGIVLQHHWIPVSLWPKDWPVGPHGMGFIDIAPRAASFRLTLVQPVTPAPAGPRLFTVVYANGPPRTFAIKGTMIEGIELARLPAALKAHKAANRDAQYELLYETKNVDGREGQEIDRAFAQAGIVLQHCWVPTSTWSEDWHVCPHGIGYVDAKRLPPATMPATQP